MERFPEPSNPPLTLAGQAQSLAIGCPSQRTARRNRKPAAVAHSNSQRSPATGAALLRACRRAAAEVVAAEPGLPGPSRTAQLLSRTPT